MSAGDLRIDVHLERRAVAASGRAGSRKVWAAGTVKNPALDDACSNSDDLATLGETLGRLLTDEALRALGARATEITSYGKGAIIGDASSPAHAAAILHSRMGAAVRDVLARGAAIIPSTVKRGAPGACLDVPLHGVDDEWNFALLDSVEVMVSGAPAADEVVIVVALRADAATADSAHSAGSRG
jgi:hypothetical protein